MNTNLFIKKWLNSIDFRSQSRTEGIADRDYWAWKTKDFANGTEQAGIFAFLIYNKSEKEYSEKFSMELIKKILRGTLTIQRSNGSFEEAYPYESSFCVTGLVQFYLLASYFLFSKFFDDIDKKTLKQIVDSSNGFLLKSMETHGKISNHLMTSFCAIQLYNEIFNVGEGMYSPLEKLLFSINEEGWFVEYDGADPGYQSLLNHYLYLFYILSGRKYTNCKTVLSKSLGFISEFSFQDGSFGGEFGSRGTSLLYPSGLFCAIQSKDFESMWLKTQNVNMPLFINDGNFVPVLNSWITYKYLTRKELNIDVQAKDFTYFENAKLLILNRTNEKLVLSTKNGCYKHLKDGKNISVATFKRGGFYTQLGLCKILSFTSQDVVLKLGAARIDQKINNPLRLIILHSLGYLIYKSSLLQLMVKKILVWFVMKNKKNILIDFNLRVNWENEILVEIENHDGWAPIQSGFYSHMASSNYNI